MAKGLYKVKHPEKYLGDPTKVVFRSAWELRFMVFCDDHPDITRWGSEEFRIPYFNPVKNKVCNYFPDFIVTYKGRDGKMRTEVIEIKPKKQAVVGKRMSTYDKVQLVINQAKWAAAVKFCEAHGVTFKILTEDQLFR